MLVGDVGGTNARFAIAHMDDGRIALKQVELKAGADFGTFEDALAHYLETAGAAPSSACIAVAGPVHQGAVHLTNRNWTVSEAVLKARFGIGAPKVINDFVAMARSVPEMPQAAFETVFEGEAEEGAPILVAGPGTGFGVATLLPVTGGWRVMPGEGGHMAYAPRTELERKLAAVLVRDYGYVSNELVASGSGLEEVHKAMCEIYGVAYAPLSPAEMRARADAGDAMLGELIRLRALTVMGAVGDLALATGALGGVVLAGGVTERIADVFQLPGMRERFVARGPMSAYLERCPVRLMHSAEAPLIGAAAHFADMFGR